MFLKFFLAIIAILLCVPFVFAPIVMIASMPDIGTRFFTGLYVFIPYVGVAIAVMVFSTDIEVGNEVRRRQMHRVQAVL